MPNYATYLGDPPEQAPAGDPSGKYVEYLGGPGESGGQGQSQPGQAQAPLTPESIEASLHDPASNGMLDDQEARILFEANKRRSLGDKVGGFVSGAWEGAKGIASDVGGAAGELVQPDNWSRIPGTLVHGAVQGTAQTAELARKFGRGIYDSVRDLGSTEDEKIQHFRDRYNENLFSERALARGNNSDKTLTQLPDVFGKPLPKTMATASLFEDPIMLASLGAGGAIEAPLKAMASRALGLVPGAARLADLASAAKAIPGKVAGAAVRGAEGAGEALAAAARKPLDKFAEFATPRLPPEASEALKKGAHALGVGGAVAAATGHGGPIALGLGALKGAEIIGATVAQTSAFVRHLMETDASAVPRLLQMAHNADAPLWIQNLAQTLHNAGVGTAAQFGTDMAHAATHGAGMGLGLGLGTSESPEELGQMTGGGMAIGSLGKGVAKVTGMDAKAKAMAQDSADYQRFFAHLKDQGVSDDVIKRIQTGPATVLSRLGASQAKAIFGKDLNFRYLSDVDYGTAVPPEGQGTAAYFERFQNDPGKTPTITVNVDKLGDKTYHELFHAVSHALGADAEVRLKILSVLTPAEVEVQGQQYAAKLAGSRLRAVGQDPASLPPSAWFDLVNRTAGELTRVHGGNGWIYDEIYADGGWHFLKGKDLVRDIANPSARRTIYQAGKNLVGKIFEALGGGQDPEVPKGALFTDPRIYQSPVLEGMYREHLKRLVNEGPAQARVGKETKEGTPIPVEVPGRLIGQHPAMPAQMVVENGLFQPLPGGKFQQAPARVFRQVELAKANEVQKALVNQPTRPAGDTSPEVAPRVNPQGEVEVTGTKIADQLKALPIIGPHAKAMATDIDALMGTGKAYEAYYHAIGRSYPWSTSVRRNLGNLQVSRIALAPFLWKVSKENNVLAVGLSITAAERKIFKWKNEKKLDGLWGGDAGKFREDLMTYLKNHAEGRPGADVIGEAKRNALNAFVAGGQVNMRDYNPLRAGLAAADKVGIVRSLRLDRHATVEPSTETGWNAEWEKKKVNFAPEPSPEPAPAPESAPQFSPTEEEPKRPIWYSRLGKALESLPAGETKPKTGQQWLGWIDRMAHGQNIPTQGTGTWKGGIAADEIKSVGLGDLLKPGGTYTKQEVMDLFNANQVQVNEVVKQLGQGEGRVSSDLRYFISREGISNPETPSDWVALSSKLEGLAQANQRFGHQERAEKYFTLAEEATSLAEDLDLGRSEKGGMPKYSQYQTPGGKDYKELLLTIPTVRDPALEKELFAYREKIAGLNARVRFLRSEGETDEAATVAGEARDLEAEYAGKSRQGARDQGNFISGHWDEPNILAHIRFNERTDAQGRKLLFLEEMQSDWHQKGRKFGYRDTAADDAKLIELRARKAEAQKVFDEAESKHEILSAETTHLVLRATMGVRRQYGYETYGDGMRDPKFKEAFQKAKKTNPEYQAKQAELTKSEEALIAATDKLNAVSNEITDIESPSKSVGKVPDAPFKHNWHELALRRMIKWAADHGFERIAWTTGDQQAERYDLSKQVRRLSLISNGKNSGHYNLVAEGKDMSELPGYSGSGKRVTPAELEETVGKDVAQKLIAGADFNAGDTHQNSKWYDSHPADLKVGGEGMKGFYDKILVDAANKIGRKSGMAVGETQLPPENKTNWEPSITDNPEGLRPVGRTEARRAFKEGRAIYVEKEMSGGTTWQRIGTSDFSQQMQIWKNPKKLFVMDPPVGDLVHSMDLTPEAVAGAKGGMPLFSPAPEGTVTLHAGDKESLPVYQLVDEKGKLRTEQGGKPLFYKTPYNLFESPLVDKVIAAQPDPEKARELIFGKGKGSIEARKINAGVKEKFNASLLNERRALTPEQAHLCKQIVGAYAEKFAQDFERWQNDPDIQAAKGWYSEVSAWLKDAIPDQTDRQMFLEFLGGTSPQTNVENNFLYAMSAFNQWKAKEFKPVLKAFNAAEKLRAQGKINGLYITEDADGKRTFKPDVRKDFVQTWIDDLGGTKKAIATARKKARELTDRDIYAYHLIKTGAIPRRPGGGRYGVHSERIMDILNRIWLEESDAPKAPNFVGNLAGTTHRATVDVWAARFLRRLGYDGETQAPWRLQFRSETGVKNADFFLGQDIYDEAARRISKASGETMHADDLQAIMWFAEKREWAQRGWNEGEDLGDFRDYLFKMKQEPSGQLGMTGATLSGSRAETMPSYKGNVQNVRLLAEERAVVKAHDEAIQQMNVAHVLKMSLGHFPGEDPGEVKSAVRGLEKQLVGRAKKLEVLKPKLHVPFIYNEQ